MDVFSHQVDPYQLAVRSIHFVVTPQELHKSSRLFDRCFHLLCCRLRICRRREDVESTTLCVEHVEVHVERYLSILLSLV